VRVCLGKAEEFQQRISKKYMELNSANQQTPNPFSKPVVDPKCGIRELRDGENPDKLNDIQTDYENFLEQHRYQNSSCNFQICHEQKNIFKRHKNN